MSGTLGSLIEMFKKENNLKERLDRRVKTNRGFDGIKSPLLDYSVPLISLNVNSSVALNFPNQPPAFSKAIREYLRP